MLSHARQFVRANRRLGPVRWVARAAEAYLRAYHNEAFFDFAHNGEAFALETFARWRGGSPTSVWDVGANTGQWSLEALAALPQAQIHGFEIVPQTHRQLVGVLGATPNVHLHCVGLSDRTGPAEVQFNPSHPMTSALDPHLDGRFFENGVEPAACLLARADDMAERLGRPDFIKIDVEGHEVAVLRGAQALLAALDGPDMIQLEYGGTYRPSGATLKQVYALLQPHGYAIGRLYPNHVGFKPYSVRDDTYRMGNFIAARPEGLRTLLSGG